MACLIASSPAGNSLRVGTVNTSFLMRRRRDLFLVLNSLNSYNEFSIISAACLIFQYWSRFLTFNSDRKLTASMAPVRDTSVILLLIILRYCSSVRSRSLPQPISSTLSASKPGTLCNNSDCSSLPSISPRRSRLERNFLLTLSTAFAAGLRRRGSKIPRTRHAVRCFSGLPLFIRNSMITSLI